MREDLYICCWITWLVSKYNFSVTILNRAEQRLYRMEKGDSLLPFFFFFKEHMIYLKTNIKHKYLFSPIYRMPLLTSSGISMYPYFLYLILILFFPFPFFSPLSPSLTFLSLFEWISIKEVIFHCENSLAFPLFKFYVAGTCGKEDSVLSCMPAKLLQSCLTLCHTMDCSLPGASVHGILQARILKWTVMASFRASSWPWDPTCLSYISCTGR